MYLKTLTLAASVTLLLTGAAFAQGSPGGGGSGANVQSEPDKGASTTGGTMSKEGGAMKSGSGSNSTGGGNASNSAEGGNAGQPSRGAGSTGSAGGTGSR